MRANTFGFYALNGTSVIDFKENSKKESICEFMGGIRSNNPDKRILVILDNFSSHQAKATIEFAEENGIELVFLPPYSPDLNPIEFIWKSIKRVISAIFVESIEHLKTTTMDAFIRLSRSLSYAEKWIDTFLDREVKSILF